MLRVDPIPLQRAERRSDRARQVRELIRIELLSRVYGDSVLPSEAQLMLRYSCSRNALREALDLLRQEGLIERVPGAGTFGVVNKEVNRHDRLEGIAEQLEEGARRVTVTLLGVRIMPAPIVVAERLGIEPGEEVVFYERRLSLDGAPLSIWSSYLPATIARGLLSCDLEQEFYQVIENQLGLTVATGEVSVDAMIADGSVASLLGCAPGAPILHLTRLVRREDGTAVEFGFAHLRGDRIQFTSLLGRQTDFDRGTTAR